METRARVQAIVKRLDRQQLSNYGDRFRFTTLQTRFDKFIELWDRALRAREEGRPGPFSPPQGRASRRAGDEEELVKVGECASGDAPGASTAPGKS